MPSSQSTPTTERVVRVWVLFTSLMVIVLVVSSSPSLPEQWGWAPWWFNTVGAASLLALPAVLVVGSLLLPFRVVRAGGRATVAGGVAAMALVPLAIAPDALAAPLWFWSLSPLSTLVCLAAVTDGVRGLAATPVLAAATYAGYWWVYGADSLVTPVRPVLGPVSFGLVFAAMAVLTRHTATAYDTALRDLEGELVAKASTQARTAERERLNTLAHDVVMAALSVAGNSRDPETHRRAAEHCVAVLDAADAEPDTAPVPAEAAVRTLRQACTDVDAAAVFTHTVEDPSAHYPPHVVNAFDGVLREALRNTVKHAKPLDPSVGCAVNVSAGVGVLSVTADDDGPGFDPDSVPEHRLGVALSMRARIARVHGARFALRSTPGAGTTVRVEWRRAGWGHADA